jgi:hypothetical protein
LLEPGIDSFSETTQRVPGIAPMLPYLEDPDGYQHNDDCPWQVCQFEKILRHVRPSGKLSMIPALLCQPLCFIALVVGSFADCTPIAETK